MKVGLEFQPIQSACYIAEDHQDEEWDQLRDGIQNGSIATDEGVVHLGISTCNNPTGSEQYVKKYL